MTAPQFAPTNGMLIDPSSISAPAFTTPQITNAVAVASGMIAGYTGRKLVAATSDTVTLTASADGFQLPQWPVTNIESISIYTDEGWTVVDPSRYMVDTTGWVSMANAPLNWMPSLGGQVAPPLDPNYAWQVRVTYDHGYGSVPVDLAAACTHLATQYLLNPLSAIEQKVGEIADRYSPADAGGFPDWVKAILDRYSDVGVA